jgi:uncharacterized protein (DUF4415 family)
MPLDCVVLPDVASRCIEIRRRVAMPDQPPRRRPQSALDRAEAVFKAPPPKLETPTAKTPPPQGKETVSLRLDRDVLAHFQDDGPGWQDRINAALRKVAGL